MIVVASYLTLFTLDITYQFMLTCEDSANTLFNERYLQNALYHSYDKSYNSSLSLGFAKLKSSISSEVKKRTSLSSESEELPVPRL